MSTFLLCMVILQLPNVITSILGMVYVNAFRHVEGVLFDKTLSTVPIPRICIRVVTRGDYPHLIEVCSFLFADLGHVSDFRKT